VAKQTKSPVTAAAVRTRRAYFDCRFGQLHVRTAFPTTGGFDEEVTLICLHGAPGSSRIFAQFLRQIAVNRSVYAPDLPGFGESDAAPSDLPKNAALAVADLAADLRLRQIDVLGVRKGGWAALELAATESQLVRRLVLVGVPPLEQAPIINRETLVLAESAVDLFDAASQRVAAQVAEFLEAPRSAAPA
jgi:pimeloyl-ACP methyl ester carboxylesterase